jgi:hypothetical protein
MEHREHARIVPIGCRRSLSHDLDTIAYPTDALAMANCLKNSECPLEMNHLAKFTVDQATGGLIPQAAWEDEKKPRCCRPGGLKGGKARASKLTGWRRSQVTRTAAR